MPKNEDGEFELILGNKQLLGMFFVVVVLLGVFFVMGYLVGRNSAPLTASEPSTAHTSDSKPLVVDSPVPKSTPAPETSTTPSPEASKPLETAVEKPAEPKPEPPKLEPTKPSTSKSEPAIKRDIAKAEKRSTPLPSGAPAAGQIYLQLSATTKHDADGVVEVLRKNSFPAIDVEVPEKPGLFRVLVGPLAASDLNKTKADLQAKGFPGNVAIRKTF
ncbi:MAG TPA: SPOR domain-containing protein [Bryobacteraceae bacterium]